MNQMTKLFRECALMPRQNPEAEMLRRALCEWRAHLLKSGRVPRAEASALLVAHGADVSQFESDDRLESTMQFRAIPGTLPGFQAGCLADFPVRMAL